MVYIETGLVLLFNDVYSTVLIVNMRKYCIFASLDVDLTEEKDDA